MVRNRLTPTPAGSLVRDKTMNAVFTDHQILSAHEARAAVRNYCTDPSLVTVDGCFTNYADADQIAADIEDCDRFQVEADFFCGVRIVLLNDAGEPNGTGTVITLSGLRAATDWTAFESDFVVAVPREAA